MAPRSPPSAKRPTGPYLDPTGCACRFAFLDLGTKDAVRPAVMTLIRHGTAGRVDLAVGLTGDRGDQMPIRIHDSGAWHLRPQQTRTYGGAG